MLHLTWLKSTVDRGTNQETEWCHWSKQGPQTSALAQACSPRHWGSWSRRTTTYRSKYGTETQTLTKNKQAMTTKQNEEKHKPTLTQKSKMEPIPRSQNVKTKTKNKNTQVWWQIFIHDLPFIYLAIQNKNGELKQQRDRTVPGSASVGEFMLIFCLVGLRFCFLFFLKTGSSVAKTDQQVTL